MKVTNKNSYWYSLIIPFIIALISIPIGFYLKGKNYDFFSIIFIPIVFFLILASNKYFEEIVVDSNSMKVKFRRCFLTSEITLNRREIKSVIKIKNSFRAGKYKVLQITSQNKILEIDSLSGFSEFDLEKINNELNKLY